jgi:galactokinase
MFMPTNDGKIYISSQGYEDFIVDTNSIEKFVESTSYALVSGVCYDMKNRGYKVGGFKAYVTSNVIGGAGISSSASFEVLIAEILNFLYNDGKISCEEKSYISQYAEREFFGKPCGLLDQSAIAYGGLNKIDFSNPEKINVKKIDNKIKDFSFVLVNTGGSHANLTDEYASIPAEMKAVAAAMGKTVLRECDEQAVIDAIPTLRATVGDRAILRALHFYAENRRVAAQKAALLAGDIDAFFNGVIASGRSSFCYLQNVYTCKNLSEQGLSLALCLAEQALAGKKAAWRVHGGGFAGTIQAFVPTAHVEAFRATMDAALGEGRCMVLRIRPVGAVKI